jgi:hypothetical protein
VLKDEFLVHYRPLAARFRSRLHDAIKDGHPDIYQTLTPAQRQVLSPAKNWNVQLQPVGRGKTALRYLARYVRRSAFPRSNPSPARTAAANSPSCATSPPSASRAARRARSPSPHDPDPTLRPAGTAASRALGTCGREVRDLSSFEACPRRSSGKRPPSRKRPARRRANRRAIRSAAPAEAIARRPATARSRQVVDPETWIETARAVASAPARPARACPTTDRFGTIARTYLWSYPLGFLVGKALMNML